tara:strand:- start:1052 stop:1873 length:822 start_codon:yes stop_codon:yes gene_type:complete
MNVKKIPLISTLILSFFLIPFNIFVLKNIYKNNLKNNNIIIKEPYIEIEILDSAKDKYNYYSKNYIKIEEVFLEVILKNFSDIYHIEKQNETFRHYFKTLKKPSGVNFLENVDILEIKRDYVDRLNEYTNNKYVENETQIYRDKILFLKEELKNENNPELKVIFRDEILNSLNKIYQLENISKSEFEAFENEIKISINYPGKNEFDFKTLKSKHTSYLKNLGAVEVKQLRIKTIFSITILNSIYILISILIFRFLMLMTYYNFFSVKNKTIKK